MSRKIEGSKNEINSLNNKNLKNNGERYSSNNKIYVSYQKRILFYTLAFIFLLVFSVFFLNKALILENEKIINYRETSSLDYKVYLKENNFYEKPYLEKNMVYIASLIDKININFNYNFNIDENIDLNFDYSVVGRLLIQDELGKNTYFEKEYILLNNKKFDMHADDNFHINETINIDYSYYNNLANNFKMAYGLDTTSNLIVYLKINKIVPNDGSISIDNNSIMSISIPLSEKSVDVKMNYREINDNSNVTSKKNIILDNIIYMVISFVCIILTLISLIKLIRLLLLSKTKKSIYDKYINKLLITYDRVIVESYTAPRFDNANIIKIKKFEELLDVRDNLKLPIMYYVVTKHHKCYFYVKHNEDFYLLVVKASDLEENKNDKIK